MMMSVSNQLFTMALLAVISQAQDNTVDLAAETTDYMKTLDNHCFHCIDEGNLFCATDVTARTGTCVAALCNE